MGLCVGMLTSGGDCQGLNSAMRGVAKRLYEADRDTRVIGFTDGYAGLMNRNYREMAYSDFSGILTLGGTILGTSRQPFNCRAVRGRDRTVSPFWPAAPCR